MKSDMRKFMPIGLLIMLIFLYLCFRELRGVLLPFAVVILSIMVAMGSIYFLWVEGTACDHYTSCYTYSHSQ